MHTNTQSSDRPLEGVVTGAGGSRAALTRQKSSSPPPPQYTYTQSSDAAQWKVYYPGQLIAPLDDKIEHVSQRLARVLVCYYLVLWSGQRRHTRSGETVGPGHCTL